MPAAVFHGDGRECSGSLLTRIFGKRAVSTAGGRCGVSRNGRCLCRGVLGWFLAVVLTEVINRRRDSPVGRSTRHGAFMSTADHPAVHRWRYGLMGACVSVKKTIPSNCSKTVKISGSGKVPRTSQLYLSCVAADNIAFPYVSSFVIPGDRTHTGWVSKRHGADNRVRQGVLARAFLDT